MLFGWELHDLKKSFHDLTVFLAAFAKRFVLPHASKVFELLSSSRFPEDMRAYFSYQKTRSTLLKHEYWHGFVFSVLRPAFILGGRGQSRRILRVPRQRRVVLILPRARSAQAGERSAERREARWPDRRGAMKILRKPFTFHLP